MNHIAIVEDDASIAEMLSFHMNSQGYQITHFADGEEARKNLMVKDYDLVLLDIMLPNCNGLDICKELRQRSPTVPILMLTSLDGEADRVIGLELGADDYLTKPFSMRECIARVKALLRRSQLSTPTETTESEAPLEKLDIAELSLDAGSRFGDTATMAMSTPLTRTLIAYATSLNAAMAGQNSSKLCGVWGINLSILNSRQSHD